jgi:dTDP-4-amino-4,6-dideoxygalactose transaminase
MIPLTKVNDLSKNKIHDLKERFSNTIKKGDFILGQEVKKFEDNFSFYTGLKYSVSCGSGTDALILALQVLNLKDNDEIIIPGLSYVSTIYSIKYISAKIKIIIVDIDKNTGLIDIEEIKKKISKKTKVIIPVNLYGQKVNIKEISTLKKKYNFKIIEDSAQSHLAYSCFNCKINNQKKCCKKEKNDKYADISCYSFYPSKNLGAFGDGGMIATNKKKIYKKLLYLRSNGSIKKNIHVMIGKNSRLDTLQASILNYKIKFLEKENDERRNIANIYKNKLIDHKKITLTKTNPGSSYHLFVIRIKNRLKFIKHLTKNKIQYGIHYPYTLNNVGGINYDFELKNSKLWSKQCISIPMYPSLKRKEIDYIVDIIRKY